ncbi:DedA family protein [Paenibacillus thiaminolyticus]|uniref:DedA family protein n=1 Tax=Paenibacillus thiaminolyticus TaxID=49283 RepID=A0AAP9DXZ0_PANTH|nr:DedA family protein [Paenibacillus thiaminolyticus]MCY9536622.1 DedA family protein [Paenibacillus thiaminolyticus]MCY9603835.1 DedA family protein [Paenibacillus thiaminolyticus]MCY9609939.1 DedA family protein [Paenibacillus thiaminolyticus]MCY9612881.1 DedA family protein [Paenibacillus thiaminolyticus]MCY9618393.1 DedA family protein [Paenibacillus thiaminolyticus]
MEFLHQIVTTLLHWVQQLGEWGIMLGLMIEVIPSEIVLAYGGYLVSIQQITFVEAVIFGVIGGVIAQLFVYWIGRYGGRPVLERYGKYILIQPHHIAKSEEWFQKYGTGVIFTARFVPVVRHAISIPAGISKMNVWRFTILTTLAVIPWTILFVYLGFVLGDKWEQINDVAGQWVKPFILVALALFIVYVVIKYTYAKKKAGK